MVELYTEHRSDLLNNKKPRNEIIPVSKLAGTIDPYLDTYRSLFYYPEEILKHVADKNTVSGYNGPVAATSLVWDFDNADPELARIDALTLVNRLITEYGVEEEEVGVFYSGKKGYNVEISTKGISGIDGVLNENIPLYVKKMCLTIGKELQTLDKGIFQVNRLFRVPGTLHNKESDVDGKSVRLFKTSLTPIFLLQNNTDVIKRYSIQIHPPEKFNDVKDTTKLSELAATVIKNVENATRDVISLPVLNQVGLSDENACPTRTKVCQWRIQQGDYTEGRNNALLRAAVHERESGKPREVTKFTLMGILEMMNARDPKKAKLDPISESEIDTLVRQAYERDFSFGCNDVILGDSLCSKKCYLAPAKFNESKIEVVTMLEAYDRSVGFFKNYYDNIVPTGFKTLDEKMPLFLGTLNLIVAPPGVGKTSAMLNIISAASKVDMPTLFFSMDMGESLVVQRAAPIFLASRSDERILSGKEFMQSFVRNDAVIMEKAREAFKQISENVLISSERKMTVKDIESEIDKRQKMWGRPIKLVIVDYVQLLKSEKEGYHNDTYNAEALAGLAKKRNLCIIGLSQTTRSSRSNDNELFSAKGSGAWEEQASTQINLFRPFKDTDHTDYDQFISFRMLKNRMGSTEKIDLYFDGASGIVRDLTTNEIGQLQALRDSFDAKDDE